MSCGLVAILGPTASGKSALAMGLARRLGGEIISGDSMLVYRGFDIGTAKPSRQERAEIPHHLIDVREPWEQFTAMDFRQEAERLVTGIRGRGRLPLLAGGTGLYAKALLEGYAFCGPAGSRERREQLAAIARERGNGALHALLAQKDPAVAARIHPNNVRRVARALEAAESGRGRVSEARDFAGTGRLRHDAFVIGLAWPREELCRRIDRRAERMFAQGLPEEVQSLLERGVTREQPAMQGIGYKETAAWLLGETTREEALRQVQRATRQFAKRQMTWYRRMPYIRWYDASACTEGQLLERALEDVKNACKGGDRLAGQEHQFAGQVPEPGAQGERGRDDPPGQRLPDQGERQGL